MVSFSPSGWIPTWSLISKLPFPLFWRYGSGSKSCFGFSTLKGSKASKVTIQGEIVDAKLFPKKGPSGTYSQAWMSLADQSLNWTNPKIYSSASSIGILSPRLLEAVVIKAISNSKSNNLEGPKPGVFDPSDGLVCPKGLLIFVPEGIMEELRPWYPIGIWSQFGNKAFSGSLNKLPTFVACSLLA